MPLDASIISQGVQAPKIDNPMDVAAKAMTMQQLANQNTISNQQISDDQASRAAYKNAVTVGPDGNPTLDRQKLYASLGQINPKTMIEQQKTDLATDAATREAQIKKFTDQTTLMHDLAYSMNDQASYTLARQKGIEAGLPNAANIPEQYDPNYVAKMRTHTGTATEQLAQYNKDREFNQKDDELGTKHEENALKRQQLGLDRNDKLGKDLDTHLDKGWVGRSGQAGVVQGKLVSAEAAQALIDQGLSQPGGLDARQIEELAQSTGKLLGGGASASARIEALVPHTAWGNVQSFKEWLTNNPTGAGQEEFVKRMAETVSREKALAENQKRQFQIEGLAAHSNLKKSDPDKYNAILQSKGITPDMIDKNGRYVQPKQAPANTGAAAHPDAPEAIQWAQQNQSDPRAQQIMSRLNGGQ